MHSNNQSKTALIYLVRYGRENSELLSSFQWIIHSRECLALKHELCDILYNVQIQANVFFFFYYVYVAVFSNSE